MLPPRLLQDHSSSGEPHYIALVQNLRSSGELLVNGLEPCVWLDLVHAEASDAEAPGEQSFLERNTGISERVSHMRMIAL